MEKETKREKVRKDEPEIQDLTAKEPSPEDQEKVKGGFETRPPQRLR